MQCNRTRRVHDKQKNWGNAKSAGKEKTRRVTALRRQGRRTGPLRVLSLRARRESCIMGGFPLRVHSMTNTLRRELTMRRATTLLCLTLSALAVPAARAATSGNFQPDPRSVQRHGPAYRYPHAGWIVLHI